MQGKIKHLSQLREKYLEFQKKYQESLQVVTLEFKNINEELENSTKILKNKSENYQRNLGTENEKSEFSPEVVKKCELYCNQLLAEVKKIQSELNAVSDQE
jgi:subtilase family serine protease